ncbi:putative amino-acid ABC transporter-binding protein precursor [Falsiruegeria litorea R37]|uniref:Putative amino-acid ABC transporter-binding protein n=1 Tax=Falsiruegeria litorea R37 TaxID=1200284 RepID=A0A1Y5TUL3_9RHOB|nr:ectoine/hydroxyectoine ABC transporter substrate-binding protein EhuB [Falsiruegeria litorea]SLN73355.1 putative amino-acid ABC transporter-binding protein precursor [Falsiruegeria litorea R37]
MKTNMLRRTVLKMTAALALAATPVATMAQNVEERGAGDGLRVAYYNFAPFGYVNSDGDVVGEQVEILRHVLGEMGLKVQSETATEWGNLIPGLKADRFDIVAAAMFVTPKRCAEVAFSEPTFGIRNTIIVPEGNPKGLGGNYEAVASSGAKLAAIAGTAQVDWAKSVGVEDGNIMQVPDNPTGLAAVRAGRADAFTIDAPGARIALSSDGGAGFEMLEPFAEVGGKPASPHGAYAFRKDEAEFVKKFNEVLSGFIGTDAHLAIMETHGLDKSELPARATSDLCNG